LSQTTIIELADSKDIKITKGTVEEVDNLFNLFDKYKPEKALLVAPHLHD